MVQGAIYGKFRPKRNGRIGPLKARFAIADTLPWEVGSICSLARRMLNSIKGNVR